MSRVTTAHPYWWLFMLSGLSWAYLISAELSSSAHSHHHMPTTSVAVFSASLSAWLIMVTAMMLPMLSGSVSLVKLMMPRYQHLRLMPLLVFGYAVVWLIAGGMIEILRAFLLQIPFIHHELIAQFPVGSLSFLAAAVWSSTSSRRKAVFACSNGIPLRINGWHAYRDTIHFGLIKGLNCVKGCLHVMLALLIAGHDLWIMMIVTVVLIYERVLLPKETRLVSWMCCILSVYFLVPWLK
ncbi:hypothetical protein BTA51_09825 [Hahella sp. CCB-MM4]|uniref:DUF2182 domain-containing protein n=1 Tax=Hahella sp. (strain CCB-MM4) TaxID=1926491 RepID=UPI000B9C180D|nr:DUF2182 domain-containing protein [Hahella sp. CCB-MM4]OZG74119.1 hypothetical protein BTA51_09825 [Hahella sp. CCB-MM4]